MTIPAIHPRFRRAGLRPVPPGRRGAMSRSARRGAIMVPMYDDLPNLPSFVRRGVVVHVDGVPSAARAPWAAAHPQDWTPSPAEIVWADVATGKRGSRR